MTVIIKDKPSHKETVEMNVSKISTVKGFYRIDYSSGEGFLKNIPCHTYFSKKCDITILQD